MQNEDAGKKTYDKTCYDGHEVTVERISAEELRGIRLKDFDFFMTKVDAVLAFLTESDEWVEYVKTWPRLGPVTLSVLNALQLNPGEFLTPGQIGRIAGYASLGTVETLVARVHAMRKTLMDSNGWFVETKTSGGYGVRWVGGRTWIWIERVA